MPKDGRANPYKAAAKLPAVALISPSPVMDAMAKVGENPSAVKECLDKLPEERMIFRQALGDSIRKNPETQQDVAKARRRLRGQRAH